MITQQYKQYKTQMIEPQQPIYFTNKKQLPQTLLFSVNNIQQQLISQIQNGNIQINASQQPLLIVNKQKGHLSSQSNDLNKNKKNQLKRKLKQLQEIKVQMANKIKMIDQEEKQIKVLTVKMDKQGHRSKLQRSIMTEQDKQKIGQAKKSQKQYENMMKQRIQNVIKQIKQKQKQREIQRNFKDDLKRKQRIVRLAQKRAKLQQSRSKTLNMLQNSHLSIKKSQYTYIRNQINDRKIQKEKMRQNQKILNEKKQKMKVDFKQLKSHQLQHDKIIQQKKQNFQFQLKQSQIRKRTKTLTYQSQFSKKLRQEEAKINHQRIKSQNLKNDFRVRIQQFQGYVEQKFKPKIKENSIFVPKKQSQKLDGLTKQQRQQKGNYFLNVAKKLAKKITPEQSRKLQTDSDCIGPSQSLPSTSSQKYPNYLIELHRKKGKNHNIFDKLMKQKRANTNHRFQEAIKWVQKKQQGNKIGINKGYIKNDISTALQKVRLLNSMYQIQ